MSEQRPLPVIDDIRRSEEINEFAKALAKAQAEFGEIKKEKTATVKGRSQSGQNYEYQYKYADIGDVLAVVRPALAKNEICILQPTVLQQGVMFIRTRLLHSSGQWVECEYPVASYTNARPQDIGASLTYARRYSLCALVGVAAEEDTDAGADPEAAAKVTETPKDTKRKPQERPERQPPTVVQNAEGNDGKKPLPPRVDEKGAGEKKPAEEEAEEIPRFTYTNLEGEPVEGFAELDFVRNLEADITDCGKGGDKDALDGLLSANAEAMKGLSEQSKTTIEKAIEKANKGLRAAAVANDPDGGESPMI